MEMDGCMTPADIERGAFTVNILSMATDNKIVVNAVLRER